MKLDPSIHIVMHSVLSLKPGVIVSGRRKPMHDRRSEEYDCRDQPQKRIFYAFLVCGMRDFPWFSFMGTCITQFTKTCGVDYNKTL
jgi:hypothetical protein